jgi:ribosomal protein L37AE/L43A
MGLFNRAFGGANGVREAMQLSYANHVADIASGKIQVPDRSEAHVFGLYGALSGRYWVRRMARSEAQLMMELAPFCAMMDKKAAIAMLAEYAVYQERPADAEVSVLRTVLNTTVQNIWDAPWLQATVQAIASGADWARLLDSDTIYVLRARIDAASESAEAVPDKIVISCPRCTQKLRVRTGPNLVATCPKCSAEIPVD